MDDFETQLERDSIATQTAIAKIDRAEFGKACDTLKECRSEEGRVWIFGNGGSAATASHFANDLLKMAKIPAISLSDQTPTMLAFGNDHGWENMFSHMLAYPIDEHDVLIGISCSGKSKNVIKAMEFPVARIILTGDHGNELAKIESNAIFFVQSPDIRIQENVHLVICHMIAGALKL